jgi:transcriptional regulator with XRE-family HTH domain
MLQRHRAEAEVSLRELGRAVGLSAVFISDLERGARRPPPAPVIVKIAERLGVDPEPLLEASLRERDRVELTVDHDEASENRTTAALTLARVWDELDDATLGELTEFLEKRKRR